MSTTPQRQPAIPKAPADRPVTAMAAKAAPAKSSAPLRTLSTRIPEDLDERLRMVTFERRLSKQALIIAALEAYLDALPAGE